MVIQYRLDITSLIFDINKEVTRIIADANDKTDPSAVKTFSKYVLDQYLKKSETVYLKLVNILKQNPDSDITFRVILQPFYHKKKNFYYSITLLINVENCNDQSSEEDAMDAINSQEVLQYLQSRCVDCSLPIPLHHLYDMLYFLRWQTEHNTYASDEEDNQYMRPDVDSLEWSLIRNLIISMDNTFNYYEHFFVYNR